MRIEMRRLQCPQCSNVWDCVSVRAERSANADGVHRPDRSRPTALARQSLGRRWLSYPNLRGGDWFIHAPYEAAQARLLAWLDDALEQRRSSRSRDRGVWITPVVTRVPACAFASALKANGGTPTYLRVNPDPPEGTRNEYPIEGASFHRWRDTWAALAPRDAASRCAPLRPPPASARRVRRKTVRRLAAAA